MHCVLPARVFHVFEPMKIISLCVYAFNNFSINYGVRAHTHRAKWNEMKKKRRERIHRLCMHKYSLLHTQCAHIELKRWNEWCENIFFLSSLSIHFENVKCKLAPAKSMTFTIKKYNRLTVCSVCTHWIFDGNAIDRINLISFTLSLPTVCALSSGKTRPGEWVSEWISYSSFIFSARRRLFVYPFGISCLILFYVFFCSIHLFIKSINFFLVGVLLFSLFLHCSVRVCAEKLSKRLKTCAFRIECDIQRVNKCIM